MTRARNVPVGLIIAAPSERHEDWPGAAVCTRTCLPAAAAGAVPLIVTGSPNCTWRGLICRLRGVWTGFWTDRADLDVTPEKANAEAGTASIIVAIITCTERIRRSVNLGLKVRTSLGSTSRLRG